MTLIKFSILFIYTALYIIHTKMPKLTCYICTNSIKFRPNEKITNCCTNGKVCTKNTNYFPKCFTLVSVYKSTNIFICSSKCMNKIIEIKKEHHLRMLEKIGSISPM